LVYFDLKLKYQDVVDLFLIESSNFPTKHKLNEEAVKYFDMNNKMQEERMRTNLVSMKDSGSHKGKKGT